ncbi:MAG: cell wall hydrolase, partial [Coleofasciculus sp. S288]|nr:cell wall hydrolase [Coleofasciculus sp. S288]
VSYPVINVKINDQVYNNQGILVNGNACIPVVFLKSLGIDVELLTNIQKITYRDVVYIKAVNLQRLNISVNWDNSTRTVILRSK